MHMCLWTVDTSIGRERQYAELGMDWVWALVQGWKAVRSWDGQECRGNRAEDSFVQGAEIERFFFKGKGRYSVLSCREYALCGLVYCMHLLLFFPGDVASIRGCPRPKAGVYAGKIATLEKFFV